MSGEVPDGRCGFTLDPVGVDGVDADWYDTKGEWHRTTEGCCCWRPTWRDHDRCIWHVDVADKGANELAATRADDPERLDGAVLREVDLGDTVSFANCVLFGADWTDADLRGADLSGASFHWADLTDASLYGADLTDAVLVDATLTDADLASADLTGVAIHYSAMGEFGFDVATTFGGRSQFEPPTIPDRIGSVRWYLRPLAIIVAPLAVLIVNILSFLIALISVLVGIDGPRAFNLEQAELQYRATQSMLRKDDRGRELPELDVREKDARRRRMREQFKPIRWLTLAGARWTTLYGESPWRVVATSLLVIAAGVVIYPHTGLDAPSLLDRLYFSVATFTPLMQAEGLPAPTTDATKIVAMTQALLGVALTALLVAVLDRRITR